jgi:hypothetical protein
VRKGISALIVAVWSAAGGVLVCREIMARIYRKQIGKRNEALEKMHVFYIVFNQWLAIRQEGRSLEEYFIENDYKTVAIYGMKEFGERLYDELKDSSINVRYAIDKDADFLYTDVDVVVPTGILEPVDAIVVTAVYHFDEIKRTLRDKANCPIISLEDIVFSL